MVACDDNPVRLVYSYYDDSAKPPNGQVPDKHTNALKYANMAFCYAYPVSRLVKLVTIPVRVIIRRRL